MTEEMENKDGIISHLEVMSGGVTRPVTTNYRLVRKTVLGEVTLGIAGTVKEIVQLYDELDKLGKLAHEPKEAYRIIHTETWTHEHTITEAREARH